VRPFYWTAGQVPELRDVPQDRREEIVEAALFSVPITPRNLAVVSGVLLPGTAAAFGLSLVPGRWVAYAWLPLGAWGGPHGRWNNPVPGARPRPGVGLGRFGVVAVRDDHALVADPHGELRPGDRVTSREDDR
jgi:hypothetical protein